MLIWKKNLFGYSMEISFLFGVGIGVYFEDSVLYIFLPLGIIEIYKLSIKII